MVSFTTILALAAAAVAAPLSVRQAADVFAIGPLGYGSNFNLQLGDSGAFAAAADSSAPAVQFSATSQTAAGAVTINGASQLVSGSYVAVVESGSSVTQSTVSWKALEDLPATYNALTCTITSSVVSCSAANAGGMNVVSAAADGTLYLSTSASVPAGSSAAALNIVNLA